MIGKKLKKINIPPKQKMEQTYCVSRKTSTGNSDMSSETIKNKAKLLKSKCLVSMINKYFQNK